MTDWKWFNKMAWTLKCEKAWESTAEDWSTRKHKRKMVPSPTGTLGIWAMKVVSTQSYEE